MTFKVFGVKIFLSYFFIFILILALLVGFTLEFFAILFALIIHEIAHILVARSFDLKVEKLEFLPFGGRIQLVFDEMSPESEMLTALAGPMANFAIAGILVFLVVENLMPLNISKTLIKYQLSLGFFNILPALPLDGGRIFVLWLRQFMSYLSAVRIATQLGKILSAVIFFFVLISFALGKKYINLLLISVALFIYSHKENKEAPLTFIAHISKKKEHLYKKGYMPVEMLVAMEYVEVKKMLYLFTPQKYFLINVLDDDMNIKKCLTESEIFDKIIEKGLDIRISELL